MLKRVYLEITNACNLNCPFCTNEKGNNFLSLNEINNYTTQIKEFSDYVYLHILGEPLLHPQFNEILSILDEKDLKLQLVTNGTLLYKYPNILKHKCLRKLSVSIHSVNNIEIDNYFNVIKSIINTNTYTNIELRFYDYDNLDDSLKLFLNELKEEYSFDLTTKHNSYKLKDNVYIYFEKLFNWPNINDNYISNIGTCHGALDMIAINSNSDVTICCLDPKAYNIIGNLKENTLKEILESKCYLKIVDDFKKHMINLDLCQKCTYRLRFK